MIIEASDTVGVDPALVGTVTITIAVDDENDNTPEWSGATFQLAPFVGYDVTASEDIPAGTIVIDTDATDADIDDNARLTFNIVSGNDDNHFTIDPDSGAVKTLATLNRENIHTYELILEVSSSLESLTFIFRENTYRISIFNELWKML